MPVIALDLGASKLASALFSDSGKILYQHTSAIGKKTGTEIGELMVRDAEHVMEEARKKQLSVSAIGIAVPGIAYAQTGRVWAPNIPGWDDYPLLNQMRSFFKNIKIQLESDRACYILGELWKGNARGCLDAIF